MSNELITVTVVGSETNATVTSGAEVVVTIGDVGPVTWSAVTGKPTTFPPQAHSHAIGDVTGLQAALNQKVELDGNGKVQASQLPSFVDDVLEYANAAALPATGETGKIYVTIDNGKVFRWSGSQYIEISAAPGSTDAVPEGTTNLYHTTGRAAAAAPVQSVAGRTGAVTLAVADVSGLGGAATLNVGTTAGTVAAGNDSRLTDQRTPADGSVTDAKIASGGLSTSSLNWAAIQPWAANTAYAKGDLVSFAGIAYRRSVAGTSGATFNTANWQQITPSNPVISVDGATGAVTVTKAETFDFTTTSAPASATGANGSYSWVVPSNAKAMRLYAIGAGGGGGSGRRGASGAARFGGGGGASAGAIQLFFSSLDGIAGKTATIAVGAGGAGGAARTTDNTDGNNGSNGGVTSVTIDGRRVQAVQGLGAGGGTASSGSAGTSVAGMFRGNSGGNSSATGTPSLPQSLDHNGFTAAGASAGGGISTGDTSFNGGQVRGDTVYDAQNNAFTNTQGGVAPGGAGANGASLSFGTPLPGGSGSGGAAGNATTPGGNGGNGGAYGGGGGGGGASFNGYASGAGGNGGNGFVRFVVFY
jgi:hypothetical protein